MTIRFICMHLIVKLTEKLITKGNSHKPTIFITETYSYMDKSIYFYYSQNELTNDINWENWT